jgi:Na+-transporting methylmalonyl-CoA/oxaloacetate decarboxylase gamma subunit
MAQNLLLALQITAIGMGLVFGSIILFWLLMAAMVRVTNAGVVKKQNHKSRSASLRGLAGHEGHKGLVDEGQPPPGRGPAGSAPTEVRRRAAAAAVAVALARRSGAAGLPARPASPPAQAGAWQMVQRAKSLQIFPRGRAR